MIELMGIGFYYSSWTFLQTLFDFDVIAHHTFIRTKSLWTFFKSDFNSIWTYKSVEQKSKMFRF